MRDVSPQTLPSETGKSNIAYQSTLKNPHQNHIKYVLKRQDQTRARRAGSEARLPISAPYCCVTLDMLLNLSVSQFIYKMGN